MIPSHTMLSVGVAISTTGDEHRLGFLETTVRHWRSALPFGSVIVVTVDGDEAAAQRARAVVNKPQDGGYIGGTTYRVGQRPGVAPYDGKQGVAVNKNTGLELLYDHGVTHMFLCDDDTYPLIPQALWKHTDLLDQEITHSMVCWGKHRLEAKRGRYATWNWPRGVLLHVTRGVVETVGGMVEDFGPGGHEHVEWSRRIHQHGLTPHPYVSPAVYAETGVGGAATRASALWHCEDMRRAGETSVQLGHRRRKITSVPRDKDWKAIEAVMASMDGNTDFVPFRAHDNGRASATLCMTSTGQGAGGDL